MFWNEKRKWVIELNSQFCVLNIVLSGLNNTIVVVVVIDSWINYSNFYSWLQSGLNHIFSGVQNHNLHWYTYRYNPQSEYRYVLPTPTLHFFNGDYLLIKMHQYLSGYLSVVWRNSNSSISCVIKFSAFESSTFCMSSKLSVKLLNAVINVSRPQ